MSENEINTSSVLTENVATYVDNQSFLSFGLGGKVNIHTGDFYYFNEKIQVGGYAFPYELLYVFVNRTSDDYTNWTLSTDQYISFLDTPILQAYYSDGLGFSHYFGDNYSNKTGFALDNSGLDLELDGYYGYFDSYIYDRKGNQLVFDTTNHLSKVIDSNGNYVEISSENYKTNRITDSFGRITNIEYNNQSKISKIIDFSNRTINFEYDDKRRLVKVIYPDFTYTEFTYYTDSAKTMDRIRERNGIVYELGYTSKKLTSIKKYPAESNTAVDDPTEFFEITFKDHTTTITNNFGVRKIYTFDETGRVISETEDVPDVVDGQTVEDKFNVIKSTTYRYTDKKRTFVAVTDHSKDEYNLLKNGSFDNDFENWSSKYSDNIYCAVVSEESIDYGKSLKSTYINSWVEQTVSLEDFDWKYGKALILSGWGKTEYGGSLLRATVQYSDDTTDSFSVEFDNSTTNWQFKSVPVVVADNKSAISVTVLVHNYSGICYIDDISLINAPIQKLSIVDCIKNVGEETVVFGRNYNIAEKVITSDDIYTITKEKNDNYDIVKTKTTDFDGNEFVSYAEYDDKHRLIYLQDYRGMITKYTYNDVGMVTSVKSWHCDEMNPSVITEPSVYFLRTMEYDETGEFLIRDGDARGDEFYTANEYDTAKCLLINTTTPNGQKTSYEYDPNNDLVTKVNALVGENEYSVLYGYENRKLTSITHNGFDYGFTYDGMGREKDVKIAGETYSTNDYLLTDTTTVTTTYATGEKMKVETDRFQQPIKTTYIDKNGTETLLSINTYDAMGRISRAIDKVDLMTYNYKYDGFGNITEFDDEILRVVNTIDPHNRLLSKESIIGGESFITAPIYEKDPEGRMYPDNAVTGISHDNGITSQLTRDKYGRTSEKKLTFADDTDIITEKYRYLSVPNGSDLRLTTMVSEIAQTCGDGTKENYKYYYDKNGNIDIVTKGSDVLVRYEYDGMNQLIREDNKQLGRSFVYQYDTAGNIISKSEHEYIFGENPSVISNVKYTYATEGWRDQLVAVDGQPITYDEIGNPTTYLGHNLTWDRVRQLRKFDDVTFLYDVFGKRCRKNAIFYHYDVDNLIRERRNGECLDYFYDTTGIVGFKHSIFAGGSDYEAIYFYRKNLQGDIIAILDTTGTVVAEYAYDAWGKCTIISDTNGIGALNPIRYRGYYYDTETGLYYLKSRYYDPQIGRFINADIYVSTGQGILGTNMYAYCCNNPVLLYDPNGNIPMSIREFVESRGGQVFWDSESKIARFTLNGITLETYVDGKNDYDLSISNSNGRMIAENYDLAYYFRVKDWSTYFPDFSWNNGNPKDGFMVTTTWHFFSKDFCRDYAKDVMKAANARFMYCGKPTLGVAIECYAHAMMLVYSNLSIALVNKGYSFRGSAKAIGYESGDWHTVFYNWIWFNDSKINSFEHKYVFYK